MAEIQKCIHTGCVKKAEFNIRYQSTEYDDWGQNDFYCSEHFIEEIMQLSILGHEIYIKKLY